MNAGVYITLGILIATVLLGLVAAVAPKVRKYRLVLKKTEPKKRHARLKAKKKKSVWIKVM
jgi:hypothetical protein